MSNKPSHPKSPTKSEIRKIARQNRNRISETEQQQHSHALFQNLRTRPEFLQSQYIAFYWPKTPEIDPRALLEEAIKLGKKCYLPVINPKKPECLIFIEYHLNDPLVTNNHGIKEPIYNNAQMRENSIPASNLDLVFLPLLAFDKKGRRLGQGAGHYDRTFAFLKDAPQTKESASEYRPDKNSIPIKKPFLIGLGFESQCVESIPADEWDILLSAIATEKRFILILDET